MQRRSIIKRTTFVLLTCFILAGVWTLRLKPVAAIAQPKPAVTEPAENGPGIRSGEGLPADAEEQPVGGWKFRPRITTEYMGFSNFRS